MIRLFAAIPVPEDLGLRLQKLQRGVPGAKWRRLDHFHITLGFFGDVTHTQAELLDERLDSLHVAPFEYDIAGAGHFGKSEPFALWVGIAPHPSLTALHEGVKRAARYARIPMEKRDFRPHITLAYLKPRTPTDRIINFEKRLAEYRYGPVIADRFFLYESHLTQGQSVYTMAASYPLVSPSRVIKN